MYLLVLILYTVNKDVKCYIKEGLMTLKLIYMLVIAYTVNKP